MLNLKIIWSAAASVGIALSLGSVGSPYAWVTLAVFVGFHVIWVYWRLKLRPEKDGSFRADDPS
jgi:bacteriorhodopsin